MADTSEKVGIRLDLNLVQEVAESGCGLPPDRYILREEDRPIGVAPAASDVPIIDLRRLVSNNEDEAQKLSSAVRSWGIFQTIGHHISPSFLDEVQDVAKKFFQLPIEVKHKYSNLKEGEFTMEGYGGDYVAREDQIYDWNDRLLLILQPEDKRKLENWPETPSSFREILNEYAMKTRKITELVLVALAKSLKLDENYFANLLDHTAEVLAIFTYYPACSRPDLVFGLRPHSDDSVLTVLLPDQEVEGLQVLKDGNWVNVPIVPHALLIKMGNLIEIMSNGIFKSPVHRVVASTKTRISLGLFYSFDPEKMLEPAEGLVDETRPSLYRKMKAKDFHVAYMEKFAQGETNVEWLKV